MKNTNKLYPKIYSIDNLRLAHKNAKRGKGWYTEVGYVDQRLDEALLNIQTMLKQKTYCTSNYTMFLRRESNKEREICKLPYYPDRICQWAIIQVIEPYLLQDLTADTYSAIPNRGIHPIVNKYRGYEKTIKRNGVKEKVWVPSILVSDPINTKYCLKLDARKYYPSIVHSLLKDRFREIFKDRDLLWILDEIVDSISTCPHTEENIRLFNALGVPTDTVVKHNNREFIDGIGIPIGNYVSQYCGNIFLSPLDHWIKEVKKVTYYDRYMDDITILGSSKEELHKLKTEIDEFLLTRLKLTIKDNWQVFPTRVRGVDFVGYRFFGEYTLLRKTTCKQFKRKMLNISQKRKNGIKPSYTDWCSFNSYKGWLQYCDSYRLYHKYMLPNVEYMHNYYLEEVKGNAEICKRKIYSGNGRGSGNWSIPCF